MRGRITWGGLGVRSVAVDVKFIGLRKLNDESVAFPMSESAVNLK